MEEAKTGVSHRVFKHGRSTDYQVTGGRYSVGRSWYTFEDDTTLFAR